MENKVYPYSTELDSALMKRLLLKKYYDTAEQTLKDIVSNNLLLPFEYQRTLNSVIAEQIINLADSTMKKINHPDSSVCQQNNNDNNLIKLEIATNSTAINEARILQTINGKVFEKKLLSIMNGENYTSGEVCASEAFVESTIQQVGADCTMGWLMQVYEMNYNHSNILIGILHMISHFSYSTVKPYGPIMALALLQHKSSAVREFAVKAVENWNSKDSLVFLKNIKCDQQWLQDYLDEVIFDIENE